MLASERRPATATLAAYAELTRAYVALTKPRIIELLLVTTVPAMVLAESGLPSVDLVAATLVGGTLSAGGANAINMYFDRDIDAVMRRTRRRPLVTGAITPTSALVFALTLEAIAGVILWQLVNALSAAIALGAAAFYVVVYTLWLKRSSPSNIVIGGAAGAAPVLIGWAAVTGGIDWPAVVLFVLIFLWTPPHFWALAIRYRDDYAAADVPMLPVVASFEVTARRITLYSLAVWGTSLVFAPIGDMGVIYIVASAVLGATFSLKALRLLIDGTPDRAMGVFGFSITYLVLLFGAMALDQLVLAT